MWFDLFQQAHRVDGSNNRFTRSKAFQLLELGRDSIGVNVRLFAFGVVHFCGFANVAIKGQNIDHRQRMATTDFIVVKVVRRGDFHAAGAFFHIGVFIANDWNTAIDQRQNHEFADQIFVAWIFRVHGHAGIAEDGFRTGGGDHQVTFTVSGFRAVSQRIADMPH